MQDNIALQLGGPENVMTDERIEMIARKEMEEDSTTWFHDYSGGIK